MKRKTFFLIAAIIGVLFSVVILSGPAKMIGNMGGQPCDTTNVVLQVVSVMLFSMAVITFLARNDPGSIALRAIIIGSIVLHIVSIPVDLIAYQKGIFTQLSGIIPGQVIHVILAIGFILCLKNLPKNP